MRTNATPFGEPLRASARVLLQACLLLVALASTPAHAQRMPQDSWYLAKEVSSAGPVSDVVNFPKYAAFGPDGNLYVTESHNHRVHVFDANGNSLRAWGKNGSDSGQFSYPRGISITASGVVYVADQSNNRVQAFDLQGKFLRTFGQSGAGDGQLNQPLGVAVDNEGNVYVADTGNYRVCVFSATGAFLRKWGSYGSGTGEFYSPLDICITPKNSVAVLDYGPGCVKFFDATGNFLSKIETNTWWAINGLAVDSTGNIYISRFNDKRVDGYSSAGVYLKSFGTSKGPHGIAIRGGNVLVCEADDHCLELFDKDGNPMKTFGRQGPATGSSDGIALDPAGNIYISDSSLHEIRKFDSSSNFVKRFGTQGSADGQLNGPRGVAIGPNQRLYVVETDGSRVQKFDLDGNYQGKFGGSGSSDGLFDKPSQIAITRAGTVFITDSGNNRVQAFDLDGKFLFKLGKQGTFYGEFKNPWGIVVTSDGALAVADTGNSRIQIFDSTGAFSRQIQWKLDDWWANGSIYRLASLGDGLIAASGNRSWSSSSDENSKLRVYDARGDELKSWNSTWCSLAETPSGDLITVGGDEKFRLWKRTFRVTIPDPGNALPLPSILSQSRRPGTALVDVDYIVKDADDDFVQTAALAFKDGGNTLRHVIPIRSLTRETSGGLGAKVSTGERHRFTWDVTSDWTTDFAEVQIEILAKDKRDLLNLDFIQIPGVQNNPDKPALKISRSPLTDNDFLSVWYWLLATGDPEITLSKGEIKPTNATVQTGTVNYDGTKGSPGWNVSFYPNTSWYDGVQRYDRFINIRPDPPMESEELPFKKTPFTASYNGTIVAPTTGTYRFYGPEVPFTTNPVDGNFNGWNFSITSSGRGYAVSGYGGQQYTERPYVDVPLVEGQSCRTNLNYYCYDGNQFGGIRLTWLRPDGVEELVPPTSVFDGNTYGNFGSNNWTQNPGGSITYTIPDQNYAMLTRTTPAGRAYLFRKMGLLGMTPLREATPAEVLRAKEAGTPGNINQLDPKLQVGPGERPAKVNSYGFDTGASGTWVVPLNN